MSPIAETLVRMMTAGELRYIETRNGIDHYQIITNKGQEQHDNEMATDQRRLPRTDAATT